MQKCESGENVSESQGGVIISEGKEEEVNRNF
jgi:hypothetical protein